jgi:hypothetical protein
MLIGDYPFYVDDYRRYVEQVLALHPGLTHVRARLQLEHTLVMVGGRDSAGARPGTVPSPDGGNYLVRLDDFRRFDDADWVIDYSLPNIHNVRTSLQFAEIAEKLLYVPPLLFAYSAPPRAKHPLVTMFIRPGEPRRKSLLESLKTQRRAAHPIAQLLGRTIGQGRSGRQPAPMPTPRCRNVTGCWGDDLRKLLLGTRILVNVHQTDHHHTLEELRVLPALLSGVIVISEDIPCRELVPYHEYIVWTDYASLSSTVAHVHSNYDTYFESFFGPRSDLPDVLDGMRRRTHDELIARELHA